MKENHLVAYSQLVYDAESIVQCAGKQFGVSLSSERCHSLASVLAPITLPLLTVIILDRNAEIKIIAFRSQNAMAYRKVANLQPEFNITCMEAWI